MRTGKKNNTKIKAFKLKGIKSYIGGKIPKHKLVHRSFDSE